MRRLSLRIRLATLTGCGAVVVLFVGAILLYRDLSGEISTAITTELQVRAADVTAVFVEERATGAPTAPVVAQIIGTDGQVLSPVGAEPILRPDELPAALAGEHVIDREVAGIGEHARLLVRPVDTRRGRVVVVAATTTEPLSAARSRLLVILGVAGPSLAAAMIGAAWLLADAALRPVHRMTREAATISMADPGRRLPQPAGKDEIAELGTTLNQMLARIESTVARERTFIDDASHELRTPLAVLRGELELASHDPADVEAVRVGLSSALEETDRLARLAEDLLMLARADAGYLQPGPQLADVMTVALGALARPPTVEGVDIEISGRSVLVRAEPQWIEVIVANLVTNATRHARHRVLVDVARAGADAKIVVADDGPGFPTELLPQAFDRFTRGENSRGRGGTGLGLAIVAAFTSALGGSVHADNGTPLGGARVEVLIPAVDGDT